MSPAIQAFEKLYGNFNQYSLDELDAVYTESVHFCDPAHEIKGLEQLKQYFAELLQNCTHCSFEIETILEQHEHASVIWLMHFSHPRLKGGSIIAVPGSSHIQFSEKIHYHRDYFDLGAMLYENIPVLGHMTRTIKKRL